MKERIAHPTVCALAIVALGFGLRLYRLDAQSFWYDEAYSAGVARATPADILANRFTDVHPPFYYLALHCWQAIGQGDFVLRLLSTVLGVAGIAAMYLLGRALCDETVGLLASAITAVAPYTVFYSQEVRMYALLFLLSALLMASYAHMLRTDSLGWWAAYAVLGALSLNTHLFSGLLILALHVHFVISHTPSPKAWRRLALSDALIVLAFVPRLGVTVVQAGQVTTDYWIARPSLAQLLSAPHAFTLSQQVSQRLVPLAFAVVLFLFILTHLQIAREVTTRRPDTAALTLTLIAFWGPILVTFVLSQWHPVYLERTLTVAVPALYFLLSWGMVRTRERLLNLALAIVLVLFAMNGLWNWYFDPAFAKPPFRTAAQFLQDKVEPGEPVLHTSDAGFLLFAHYVPGCGGYLLKGDPTPALPLETFELFGAQIIGKEDLAAPRFWLVIALDNSVDFQLGLVDWMDANHTLRQSYALDGISLRHYQGGKDSQE